MGTATPFRSLLRLPLKAVVDSNNSGKKGKSFWLKKAEMTIGTSEGIHAVPKVYRNLVKAVRKHVGKEPHKAHFADFIKQEFRKNSNLQNPFSDPSLIRQKIKLASDYTFYLNSVHQQKDLLFSYNIGMDRSDEMKKVLGKSAASVGLHLPDVYQA